MWAKFGQKIASKFMGKTPKNKMTIAKFKAKKKFKKAANVIKQNKFETAALAGTLGLGGLMIGKKESEVSLGRGFYNPETGKYVKSIKQTYNK